MYVRLVCGIISAVILSGFSSGCRTHDLSHVESDSLQKEFRNGKVALRSKAPKSEVTLVYDDDGYVDEWQKSNVYLFVKNLAKEPLLFSEKDITVTHEDGSDCHVYSNKEMREIIKTHTFLKLAALAMASAASAGSSKSAHQSGTHMTIKPAGGNAASGYSNIKKDEKDSLNDVEWMFQKTTIKPNEEAEGAIKFETPWLDKKIELVTVSVSVNGDVHKFPLKYVDRFRKP